MRVAKDARGFFVRGLFDVRLSRVLVAVADGLLEWRRRHRSRRQLKMMSDHMCKDIGISTTDAWREAEKPFWKA